MSAPTRQRRDCQCVRSRHEHGTLAGYKQCGCRCDECRAAVADRQRQRYVAKALGRWEPVYLSPVGAQRRLQALAILGWSPRMIGIYCDVSIENLARIRCGRKSVVSRDLHNLICAAYNDLWDKTPPRRHRRERDSVTRTQRYAARAGWLPPLAWDDETIDEFAHIATVMHVAADPPFCDEIAVEQASYGRPVDLTRGEMADAIGRLGGMGYSARQIGERLRVTERTVTRYRAKGRAA